MAYRSSSTNSGSSATPSTAVPSGVQSGDIVILVAAIDSSSAVFQPADWPAGFTELQESQVTADGHKAAIGWKRLTGADSGSYTFGSLGATADWVCQAAAFSGRHASNNPVVSSASVQNTAQTSPITVTANGVTAVNGDDLLWASAPDVTSSGAGNGHDAPANFTERQDAENLWSNLSTATRDNVGAGATGNISGTFNLSQDTAGWAAFLVRIPAAAAGAQTVSPGGIASEEAFGSPALQSVATIAPGGIAGAEAFGSPTLQASNTISPGGIASEEAFGSPALTNLNTVAPPGIESAEAFGNPTLAASYTITANGIASAEAFGDSLISAGGQFVNPGGIASAEAFGGHTVTPGAVNLLPAGIASAEAFGAPSLAAVFTIGAPGIASAEAFGQPAVNLMLAILAPTGIASGEAFGAVVILGGGAPLALRIDNRSFGVSWIDSRSVPASWVDSQSVTVPLTDNRSAPAGWIDNRTLEADWIDDLTIDLE